MVPNKLSHRCSLWWLHSAQNLAYLKRKVQRGSRSFSGRNNLGEVTKSWTRFWGTMLQGTTFSSPSSLDMQTYSQCASSIRRERKSHWIKVDMCHADWGRNVSAKATNYGCAGWTNGRDSAGARGRRRVGFGARQKDAFFLSTWDLK